MSEATQPPGTGGAPEGAPKVGPTAAPKADPKAGPKAEPRAAAKAEGRAGPKNEASSPPSPGERAIDPKPAAKPGAKPRTEDSPGARPATGAPTPPQSPSVPARASSAPRPSRAALWLALLALVVAIAAPAWVWQWSQKNFQELARRVQDSDARSSGAAQQASQAIDQVRELRSRTEVAEAKLAEAAGQQAQLEKLYRSVALDSADAMLAELESALSLAAQQLASGGGAESALLALQSADGRLARLDDPALVGVRRAITRDIERLRSATSGDIGVLAARLDNLARGVDDWPLKADAFPRPDAAAGPAAGPAPAEPQAEQPAATEGPDASTGSGESPQSGGPAGDAGEAEEVPAEPGSFLDRLRAMVKVDRMLEEVASLFRVRRVDAPDAALIAPDQAYFLRENLRLRLLNARLALLSRNDPLFRSDIAQAVTWIERYFDRKAPAVERALVQLEQLSRARTAAEAPSVSDSLGAVRAARAARESRQ